ncbi:MAG TPA: aminomethyltransferase family protein [Candidatus Binatia bacterium]|nr:aminomethyltransferase family protein [Candidatus Binatia bacterium]
MRSRCGSRASASPRGVALARKEIGADPVIPPSPFAELARARGAVFEEYAGLTLVEKYVDPLTEYAAVRAGAGLFDRSYRTALRFSGADRMTFLHNLLSNDIAALHPGMGCYATLLTRESKLVADANVFCMDDCVRLDLDVRVKDRARSHLEKFIVADDVEIEDRTELETSLGIHGPRSIEILSAPLADGVPRAAFEHVSGTIAGVPVLVARIDWTGDPGFEVTVARPAAPGVWQALLASGAPLGLRTAGMAAAEILRLEAGIPYVGVDFDESHLVLEAGLERGVNFQKGCYLGQEIVERASARGHVNRRLVGLRIHGERVPARGARILKDGAETGRVTSAVFSPHLLAPIALGYVRRDAIAAGTRVEVEISGATAIAEVAALPFYHGEGRTNLK